MDQASGKRLDGSLTELLYTSSLLVDAMLELLIEKNIVSREEILAKVKSFKEQGQTRSRLIH